MVGMVKVLMKKGLRSITLLIQILLWRFVVRAMTRCINTRKKAEKKDGLYERNNSLVFDPYLSSQSACSLSVEEETCKALAEFYDNSKKQ